MRLLRAVTILALLLSPLYAGYAVEWTLGSRVWTLGTPTISDVDGDGIPDAFMADDDSVWVISGAPSLIWTFPFVEANTALAFGPPFVVTNTDDDPANELVVSTATVTRPSGPNHWQFGIYDCASHALEFTSPEGQAVVAVVDVDGDGRAEILALDTNFVTTFVYGWAGGSVNENPPSSPPTRLAKASPTPARHSVNFTLPASAGPVRITIADATGRIVRTLSAPARPGPRDVQWDCLDNSGRPVPTGAYIYQVGKTSGKLEVVK